MIGRARKFWHQYVLGHFVVFHEPLVPDEVIRDRAGKPAINVFNQDTFKRPDAHYECNCGQEWGP